MARPKSNRAKNLRDLKRAGDNMNSAILKMFSINQNYIAHKAYQEKYFGKATEHTEAMIVATEVIRDKLLELQTLVIAMATDIDKN